ncbi:MAG: hypothetical protein RJA70_2409 [Pseudomonadota bacterium]|jgi:hypothetical protein
MAVKVSRDGGDKDSELRRGRTLAGAAVTITIGLVALLTIPRPVALGTLPAPSIAWAEVESQRQKDAELVAELRAQPLPLPVRAVGELIRRIGKSEAAGSGSADGEDLTRSVKTALREHGTVPLLRLRALQSRLFLVALAEWQLSGVPGEALHELGGGFVSRAIASGWVDAERRSVATDAELLAMYRIRWGLLTGLSVLPEFEPDANDWRLYYGFRLQHPEGGSARDQLALQLSYLDGLRKYDLTYPADYAKGILSFRLGAFDAAFDSFRSHLAAHPSGRLTIRAQNGAAAAAAAMLGQR